MTTTVTIPTTDIANDPVLAGHAAEIRRLYKRALCDAISIGARLVDAKRICGHGNWLPWLKREFGWTEKTAENFINVVMLAAKIENFSNLHLPISGAYLLAAPSTPCEARDQIIERAQAGEPISVADVKETIATVRRGIVTSPPMHPYSERGHDLYETPPQATRALLAAETFEGAIWECADGRSAISRELRAAGYSVVATDLVDYGTEDARGGVDFLTQTSAPTGVRTILTNPPFKHANEFVRHALTLAPHVVFLLRLAFLEGVGRSDIIEGGQLARVYVFRNRLPMLHRDGWDGPRATSSTMPLAWFVWEREHRGPTELRRISWADKTTDAQPPVDDGFDIPGFLDRTRSVAS